MMMKVLMCVAEAFAPVIALRRFRPPQQIEQIKVTLMSGEDIQVPEGIDLQDVTTKIRSKLENSDTLSNKPRIFLLEDGVPMTGSPYFEKLTADHTYSVVISGVEDYVVPVCTVGKGPGAALEVKGDVSIWNKPGRAIKVRDIKTRVAMKTQVASDTIVIVYKQMGENRDQEKDEAIVDDDGTLVDAQYWVYVPEWIEKKAKAKPAASDYHYKDFRSYTTK